MLRPLGELGADGGELLDDISHDQRTDHSVGYESGNIDNPEQAEFLRMDGGAYSTEGGSSVRNTLYGLGLIGIEHILRIVAELDLTGELLFRSFEEGLPHRTDNGVLFHIAAHKEDICGLFGGHGRRRNKRTEGDGGKKGFDTGEHVGLLGQRKARSEEGQGPTAGQYMNLYTKNPKGNAVNQQWRVPSIKKDRRDAAGLHGDFRDKFGLIQPQARRSNAWESGSYQPS